MRLLCVFYLLFLHYCCFSLLVIGIFIVGFVVFAIRVGVILTNGLSVEFFCVF
jgi:hypothetical protein